MTDPTPQDIPGQHNYGSGVLIGGDNHGSIEMVDAKTKALLEKVTQQAPALGKLLGTALKDGVISKDTVEALERATWSINADVVHSLSMATRGINQDVAGMLSRAASAINYDVAEQIAVSTTKLETAVEQLKYIDFSDQIGRLDSVGSNIAMHAGRAGDTVTPPSGRIIVNWKVALWAFIIGVVVGAMLIGWNNTH